MIDASIFLTTDGAPLPVERDLRPMATSLVVVPPFLKHFGGPLAGPAYLKGAGERAGHQVQVLDLNEVWIRERISCEHASGEIKGDHDKPSRELGRIQQLWQALCASHWPAPLVEREWEERVCKLYATQAEVAACSRRLAAGGFGDWVRGQLLSVRRPDIAGLSVMFSGQVIGALAITEVLRQVWPGTPVVWGGAHVTALAEPIGQDVSYGQGIDGFVAGYAERTWVDLLDAVASRRPWPKEVFAAGSGPQRAKEDGSVSPAFDLSAYQAGSLTLPVQASRGCAYGKCSFCTYPKIEGKHRKLAMSALEPVIQLAASRGAVLSFKDSLLVPSQLKDVGALIGGRVQWSACTKLHDSFDAETLRRLYAAGLRTLEIGLETLDGDAQLAINKPQSPQLLRAFLDAAAESGVGLVINYMTGLPGADGPNERRWLELVRAELAARPNLKAIIEHNTFQLEMLSPMGQAPAHFGLEVVGRWPWSSLLEFRLSPSATELAA